MRVRGPPVLSTGSVTVTLAWTGRARAPAIVAGI